MCDPVTWTAIAIGASVGAATSAATGNDPLMGALIGGATAGFFPGSFGVTAGSAGGFSGLVGSAAGPTFLTGLGANVALGGVAQAAGVGLVGGYLMNSMTPQTPDYSQYGYGAQPYEPQGFSYQQPTVTGSGGSQAAAVLAEEIKTSRTLRQRQQEETTAYSVAGELASTGLQIA